MRQIFISCLLTFSLWANFEPLDRLPDYLRDRERAILVLQQFPQYAHSVDFRHKFYLAHWQNVLEELVNNQLIIADAEEKKVGVSDGDIRKELEDIFGPNVVETIDSLGMTHEEAWEMVKTDVIVSRMKGMMVQSKAAMTLQPKRIRALYENIEAEKIADEEWRYRVLSIRHKKPSSAELAARAAYEMIQEQPVVDLEAVKRTLEEQGKRGEVHARVKVSLTDSEQRPMSTLAEGYREAITRLEAGQCSEPCMQVSRIDNSTVYRIFYLEDHVIPIPPPLMAVESQIQNQLFMEAASAEYRQYISKLRDHFEVDQALVQSLPEGFEPFILN